MLKKILLLILLLPLLISAQSPTFPEFVAWATKAPLATKANMALFVAGAFAVRWGFERIPISRSRENQQEILYAGQLVACAATLKFLSKVGNSSFGAQCLAHASVPAIFGVSGIIAGSDLFDKMFLGARNFFFWGCLPAAGGLAAVLLKQKILG